MQKYKGYRWGQPTWLFMKNALKYLVLISLVLQTAACSQTSLSSNTVKMNDYTYIPKQTQYTVVSEMGLEAL